MEAGNTERQRRSSGIPDDAKTRTCLSGAKLVQAYNWDHAKTNRPSYTIQF